MSIAFLQNFCTNKFTIAGLNIMNKKIKLENGTRSTQAGNAELRFALKNEAQLTRHVIHNPLDKVIKSKLPPPSLF